ncbi:MAG: type III polyketide synthase [Phycisphaeraceae bacterium]
MVDVPLVSGEASTETASMSGVDLLSDAMEEPVVSVLGLGTAVPPYRMPQDVAAAFALERYPGGEDGADWVRRRYERSGVASRCTCLPMGPDVADSLGLPAIETVFPAVSEPGFAGPTTGQRMALYERCAPLLLKHAAGKALASAGVRADRITHLVTTTCTGFFSPGPDHHLIASLGMSPSVERVQVGFMGCHAAINGLGVATALARSHSGARVLLACVELCSLHFQYRADKEQVVANALFGDGAAAAVIGREDQGRAGTTGLGRIRVVSRRSEVLGGSGEAMSWRITDHGFRMTLGPEVPRLLRSCLEEQLVDHWLGSCGLRREAVSGWAVHPGGPRVLDAVERALGLSGEALSASRAVLQEHGNMSSPTVLFILHRLLASGVRGPVVLMAFGPGLTLELALVWVE